MRPSGECFRHSKNGRLFGGRTGQSMPIEKRWVADVRGFFRDIPIRMKLMLIIALAIGFALLVAGAAVVLYESDTFRPRSLQEAETQAHILAEILVPSL